MDKDLVIGIDSSTTGCKAIVWDLEGNPKGEGRAELKMIKPKPDWHEQDAESWWEGVVKALRIATLTIDPEKFLGLCICPQRETFVAVDKTGKAIRNAILWMDTRASDLMSDLVDHIGDQNFHQITGKPLSGNLTLLKILWLHRYEPDIFSQAAKFLDVAAFLNQRLTGNYVTGWGIAGPAGFLDLNSLEWSKPVLDLLVLENIHMPDARQTGGLVGEVTKMAANETGLPEGLPVYAGIGDGQAGGLGLGISKPGECYLSLGTSVVSGTFSERYVTSKSFRTMLAPVLDHYFLETVILGGTYTVDWFMDNFGQGMTLAELYDQIQEIPPGADGLLLLPYWHSVLNPYWDPSASGMIIGWRGHHGPSHLYRAILEGIALEVRTQFEGVEKILNRDIHRLVVTGGGSNSDIWCQIISDVSGKTIYRSKIKEATALGAGIIAAVGACAYPDYQSAASVMSPPISCSFSPDPTNVSKYDRIYKDVYRELYPSIRDVMGRLAVIAEDVSSLKD